jgi:hypothetical protein
LGDDFCLVNVDSNNYSSVVEKVAVSSKRSVNDSSDLENRWPLKNYSSNKVFCRIIVGNRAVDKNRRIDILQCGDINSVKVVNAVGGSSITSNTVIRDISFGEEINDIGLIIG